MKSLIGTEVIIVLAVVLIGGGLGWARHLMLGPADETKAVVSIFEVEGMDCTQCETGVEAKVMALDGVIRVRVSHIDAAAEVTYDPNRSSAGEIADTITALGFQAKLLGEVQGGGTT